MANPRIDALRSEIPDIANRMVAVTAVFSSRDTLA
jgi:hypothetical protein